MNNKKLAKCYDLLNSEELIDLIIQAGKRGDRVEVKRLIFKAKEESLDGIPEDSKTLLKDTFLKASPEAQTDFIHALQRILSEGGRGNEASPVNQII